MQYESSSTAPFAAGRARGVMSAGTLTGDRVRNLEGESLGKIEEIMIDLDSGAIAYAVLSFGGFLGIGDKLFAIPWGALTLDEANHEFILNANKATLENAPGFDKDNWPDMADPAWGSTIHSHYGQEPYWDRTRSNTNVAGQTVGAKRSVPLSGSNDTKEPATGDAEAARERLNQPDLPEELRRASIDVTNFPGRDADADLRTSDPSRTYAVNDVSPRSTRK